MTFPCTSLPSPPLPPSTAQNEGGLTSRSISPTNLSMICIHREKIKKVLQSFGFHELWDDYSTISPHPRVGLGRSSTSSSLSLPITRLIGS